MADKYMEQMATNLKTLVIVTKDNIKEAKKDKDKENIDKKREIVKAERDFKKLNAELKNPSSPMNRLYIKMMQTSLGKMTVGFLKTTSFHVKTYYSKMVAIASGLFNRMFGKILDDIRPFFEAFKATATFLVNAAKDLAKGLASITLSILKFPISLTKFMYSMGTTIYNFLKPKKDTPEVKVAKKQLSVETKILRVLGKQTRYLGWIEKNTAASYITGALGARKYGRIKKAFKGGIGVGGSAKGALGTAAGAVGTAAGAVGSAVGTVGSVAASGLSLVGNVAGFFGKMVPYVGAILGPLLATGVPIILGAAIFRGLWEKFKEIKTGKWVDEKIWTPIKDNISQWWENEGKGYAIAFGKLIWNGFASMLPPWMEKILSTRETDEAREEAIQQGKGEQFEAQLYRRSKYKTLGLATGMMAAGALAASTGVGLVPGLLLMGAGGVLGYAIGRKAANIHNETEGDLLSREKGGPVPIMAHEGEYVIRKTSVDKYGAGFLDTINKGSLPSFDEGGLLKTISNLYGKYVGFPTERSERGGAGFNAYLTGGYYEEPKNTAPSAIKSYPSVFNDNYSSADIEKKLKYYFGDQWQTMGKIMMAESGGYTDARRSNNWNNRESGDFGLFQINALAWKNQLLNAGIIKNSMEELYDPDKNMEAAAFVLEKQGLEAWKYSKRNWDKDYELKMRTGFKRGMQISSPFGEKNDGLFGSIWDMLGSLGSLATSIFKELLTAMGILEPETLGTKTGGGSKTGRAVADSRQILKETGIITDPILEQYKSNESGGQTIIISGGGNNPLKEYGFPMPAPPLQPELLGRITTSI